MKWKDKHDVLCIRSEFKNKMVETTNRHGQKKIKPLLISEYNKNMPGIDRQDQMMSYYPAIIMTILCVNNFVFFLYKFSIYYIQLFFFNN